MDRFLEMAAFVAVAEEGSFLAAAKRLDMSAPSVTRAVAGLEDRLGVQVLCRTTRHVRITPAGQRYLEDARPILKELEIADESMLGTSASLSGEISIAAPAYICQHFVAPIVAKYLKYYTEMQVSVTSVDRPINLDRESFDLNICFGALQDTVPHAVVGEIRDVYCATPAYLQTHGRPTVPADLEQHILIDSPMRESSRRWAFQEAGERLSIIATPRMSLSNLDACLAAVSCDFGIAQLASYQVAEHITSGTLEVILQGYETPPYALNVVHRPAPLQTARAKTFFDFLVKHLGATRQLQPINNTTEAHRKATFNDPFQTLIPPNVEPATQAHETNRSIDRTRLSRESHGRLSKADVEAASSDPVSLL